MSGEISTVFFDFDGVLTLEADGAVAICKELAARKDVPYETFRPIYKTFASKIILGRAGYENLIGPFNSRLFEELGISLTTEDILEAATTSERNEEMLALAEELRAASIETGIITDNNIDRMQVLDSKFGLSNFNPVIISANEGCGKWQNPRIFRNALKAAGVTAEQALFIDNDPANLLYADQIGMHTFYHDDVVNNVSAVRAKISGLGVALGGA